MARLTTMGELAASIAHEINQPLAAVIANANAALRWLARRATQFEEAKEALNAVVKEGNRASEVIGRVRLFQESEAGICGARCQRSHQGGPGLAGCAAEPRCCCPDQLPASSARVG